ncbi:MAG: HAD hydrolase-like protein, partial [candidate division Zixibacteria bacterium]|nr:HAD hydrolase-like protein [candidate division Zixibacteria bacterium]
MSIAQFLVFDLDDTLLDTSDVYYLARKRFLDIMTEAGFEESKTLEVFEEIDAELIRVMKHSPARYGESMKLTYGKLAKSDGKSLSNDTLSRIEACGEMVPNGIPNIIDGARNLLDWSVRNYTVGLFTRGENWLQSRKVEASGLAKYFTHFEVVKEKNADVLGKFIKKSGFDPSNTWI